MLIDIERYRSVTNLRIVNCVISLLEYNTTLFLDENKRMRISCEKFTTKLRKTLFFSLTVLTRIFSLIFFFLSQCLPQQGPQGPTKKKVVQSGLSREMGLDVNAKRKKDMRMRSPCLRPACLSRSNRVPEGSGQLRGSLVSGVILYGSAGWSCKMQN